MLAVFRCTATGYPLPKIVWTGCEESDCEVSSDKTPTSSFSELSLANLTRSGEFSCLAYNDLGNATAQAHLQVNFCKPGIAPFQGTPKINLFGGKFETFCNASGLPLPRVRWLRSGVEVSQGPELRIENLAPQHVGEYVCVATNYHGEMTRYGHLLLFLQ